MVFKNDNLEDHKGDGKITLRRKLLKSLCGRQVDGTDEGVYRMVRLTASDVESSCPAVAEWYVSNSIVCQMHRLQIIGRINVNVPLGMEEN
jgi:hypothetical protein